ncbi:VPLPA-CTERM sorting domain-containing protein [Phaeovibrio sulfidiphilus]|uniref:VPLPA-CTERM sorting domain-containing protein n=1 Tax=Phaeovibrio sulfidiphilus TaxID=1220600 RepID=A0A8J6YP16_9PROT|nr:VPLPA-CTERM sorting domain-containing protein [Phaeovibrio sulfidiphilus]MBE1236926.1 VPLPA-CTERM sorting domain-containing protein [Phaeovibrio sulfidiphilus]
MNGILKSIRARSVVPLLFLSVALGAMLVPSSSRAADDTYFHRFERVTVNTSYGFSGRLMVGRDVGPPWNPEVTPVSQIQLDGGMIHKLPVPGGGTDWNKSLGIRLEVPLTLVKPMALKLRLSIPEYRIAPDDYVPFEGEGIVFNIKGRGVDWSRSISSGPALNEWETHKLAYLEPGEYVLSMSGVVGGFGDRSVNAWSFSGNFLMFSVGVVETDVPLPGALILLGTALAGAGAVARRRHRAVAGTGGRKSPSRPGCPRAQSQPGKEKS